METITISELINILNEMKSSFGDLKVFVKNKPNNCFDSQFIYDSPLIYTDIYESNKILIIN